MILKARPRTHSPADHNAVIADCHTSEASLDAPDPSHFNGLRSPTGNASTTPCPSAADTPGLAMAEILIADGDRDVGVGPDRGRVRRLGAGSDDPAIVSPHHPLAVRGGDVHGGLQGDIELEVDARQHEVRPDRP